MTTMTRFSGILATALVIASVTLGSAGARDAVSEPKPPMFAASGTVGHG